MEKTVWKIWFQRFNEKGEKISFEQIAVIPLEERIFAILKPIEKTEGVGEDEALVFEVYNQLMDEEEAKQKIDKKNNN